MIAAFVGLISLAMLSAIAEILLPDGKLGEAVNAVFGLAAVGVVLALISSLADIFP